MTKQTKILISVVLSFTFLLLMGVVAFADTFSGVYVGNETLSIYDTEGARVYFSANGTYSFNDGTDDYTVTFTRFFVENQTDYFIFGLYGEINGEVSDIMLYHSGFAGWIFPDYRQLDITSAEFDSPFSSWFDRNFLPENYNPFSDIITMVVDALDVPLFGTFSLWDMLTTICGLFAVIWLLKLLAGG